MVKDFWFVTTILKIKKWCFLLLTGSLFSAAVSQTTKLNNQIFTTPQFFSNLDTLQITNCSFKDIVGDALRFDNVKVVFIQYCSFTNISNTGPTRAAICGRQGQLVSIKNSVFDDISGTAIRFPTDGTSTIAHRLGTVVIDSVAIHNVKSTSNVEGTGIRVFHTDSLFVQNSTIRLADANGISVGRNSSGATQLAQKVVYCVIAKNRIDSTLGDGILCVENVANATVKNNVISNIAFDGIGTRPAEGDHGMYWQSSGGIIENNTVFKVFDGLVSGNPGSGISLRTDATVNANIIFGCTGNGIGYFNDHPGKGLLTISNNQVYDNDRNGIYINGSNNNNLDPASVRHPDSLFIFHNTVINKPLQPNSVHSSPVVINNMSSYNKVGGNLLMFEGFSDTALILRFIGTTPSQNKAYNFVTLTDPGFVDRVNSNFALKSTSPAIDFVPNAAAFISKDFAGKERTGNHDAGALEYQVSTFIGKEVNLKDILVVPNPFFDSFRVVDFKPNSAFKIIDPLGNVVSKNETGIFYQLDELPAGVYFLLIEDAKGTSFKHLIKR